MKKIITILIISALYVNVNAQKVRTKVAAAADITGADTCYVLDIDRYSGTLVQIIFDGVTANTGTIDFGYTLDETSYGRPSGLTTFPVTLDKTDADMYTIAFDDTTRSIYIEQTQSWPAKAKAMIKWDAAHANDTIIIKY
jgi:hypothetical protein